MGMKTISNLAARYFWVELAWNIGNNTQLFLLIYWQAVKGLMNCLSKMGMTKENVGNKVKKSAQAVSNLSEDVFS